MARYLGATPFRELLAHSIAADPTVRAAADALDNVLNAAARAVPDVLVYARLARDSGFVDPVPMLPPLTRLAALSGGLRALPEQVLICWPGNCTSRGTRPPSTSRPNASLSR